MKKIGCAATLVLACATVPGLADDSNKQAKTPWDIAYGAAIMSNFIIRGISVSNHRPAVAGYFEPSYNFSDSLQAYARILGHNVSLPNRTAVAIEIFTGVRPTFGKLALDFGFWEHWLPGGQCFNPRVMGGLCDVQTSLPPGNVIKADLSFSEFFAKAIYNVDKRFSYGGEVYWTPSVLNSGDDATYVDGTAKYILPTVFPLGIGWFISGELGHWFRENTPYKSYTNWDVGLAFTWKQFTLDLRYSDANQHDCNTIIQPGSGALSTPINSGGRRGNECAATFIAKLSVDLTSRNLK
jgi:Bacterial protein of unknown function (Gcw_chp)